MKHRYQFLTALILSLLLVSSINAQWVDTGCPFGGYSQAIAVNEPRVFVGTNSAGVYYSPDNGATWSQVNNGLTNTNVKALAFAGSNIFAGTSAGGIFRSSDNGSNWTEVNSGLSVLFINTFAVSGLNIFAGARYSVTGGGVFLSTNNGDNWNYVGLTDYEIYSLVILNGNVFAGTDNGVYLSTDNGANWTHVSSGLTQDDVYSLTVSNGNLYAGTSDGMFFSNNNGSSWTDISGSGLQGKAIRSIAIYHSNIIAGTDGWGVYLSTNNGTSWEANSTGFSNPFPAVFALTLSSTKIYAGTLFIGTWERPLNDYVTSVNLASENIPDSYNLAQNYPNPFNPSTTIGFSIPEESFVELKVFDVLGNEVALLVNDHYPAGAYNTDFNNAGLTSGAYFYRIEAGSYVEIKKMTLLK